MTNEIDKEYIKSFWTSTGLALTGSALGIGFGVSDIKKGRIKHGVFQIVFALTINTIAWMFGVMIRDDRMRRLNSLKDRADDIKKKIEEIEEIKEFEEI